MIAVVSGWPEASRASAAMSLLPAARKLPLPQRLEVMDAIFASLSLPEDRKRGLASYAIGGEEQLAEALSIAANDGEKLSAKKAVYDANKARLSGPEKFVSLIDLAQSTSEGVVRDLLRLAFENRAEQKIAGTAIEQAATIASSMSPSSDDAELFRVMAAVYEGSIKPEGLVSSAKEATRFDILRMCSEYPWFLRKLERSDLVPDLASVCDLWLRSNAFDRSIRGNVIKILIVEAALAGPDIHREVVQILGDATVSENLMSIVPELVRNDATEIARSMMDKVRNKNPDDLVWTLPDDQQLAAAQLAAYLAVLKATGTEHLGR